MAKRRGGGIGDVHYHVPGKKRPVSGSSKATSDFLAIIHEQNPTATIAQLRAIITDRSLWLPNPEAIAVLDAHIKAGYSDFVPNWR